jgi:hypothetical protein
VTMEITSNGNATAAVANEEPQRTPSLAIERRRHKRHPANLPSRLLIAGLGTQIARVIDLSQGGAAVKAATPLKIGEQGTLELDEIPMPLPFVVRNVENETMHLAFRLDAADTVRLAGLLERAGLARAA